MPRRARIAVAGIPWHIIFKEAIIGLLAFIWQIKGGSDKWESFVTDPFITPLCDRNR